MSSTAIAPSPAPALVADKDDRDLVLSVQGVSKHFKLWGSPTERLRYSVFSQLHKTLRTVLPARFALLEGLAQRRDALYKDFTALQELSFEVRRGESVGILGRNGAGKSTLLQIIAGTLRPSTGRVEVYGRTAALLELGSGFNMEFTGRENVYLNAATLGFSQDEIDRKFDDIASFADIGEFLDQPVKTYSSGMMVRLAFSVQMAIEPTLFIIDEALAVGDIYFQSKCNKLLRTRIDGGLTLLLVSHNPAAVRTLCQRGLVLNRGRCVFFGASDEAVNIYHALGDVRRDGTMGDVAVAEIKGAEDAALQNAVAGSTTDIPPIPQGLTRIQDEIGSRELVITGCELFDATGRPTRDFAPGDALRAAFSFRSEVDTDDVLFGFAIRDRYNNVVAARTSANQKLEPATVRKGRSYNVFLALAGRLGPGEYLLDFGLGCLPDGSGSAGSIYHRVGGLLAFSVSWGSRHVAFQGICDLSGDFSPSMERRSLPPAA